MTQPIPTQPCSAAPQDLQALLTLASDFRWELDEALRFSAISGPLVERGILNPQSLMSKRLTDWPEQHLREGSATEAALAALRAHKEFRDLQCAITLSDDTPRWFALSGLPRVAPGRPFCGYQGVATDITHRLDEEAHYRHLAYHDALTGLPNRRLFNDRVEQAINQARRQGTRLAVMLIDLDQFKLINDRYGHAAGDRTLIAVANSLRNTVRQSDTVARLGGDEFVAMLPRVGQAEDALRVARKMIDTLSQTGPHMLSVSIGTALFPDHGTDLHSLLMQADQAMYAAKRDGGRTARLALAVPLEQLR